MSPQTVPLLATVPHYPDAITSAAACEGCGLTLVLLPGEFAKLLFASHKFQLIQDMAKRAGSWVEHFQKAVSLIGFWCYKRRIVESFCY